jgi:hypothetical protein
MDVLEQDNLLSNRLGLQIATRTPPWDARGYIARYEIWMPHDGTYTLYVREVSVDGTPAPVRWRFDAPTPWRTNQWADTGVLEQRQETIHRHGQAHRVTTAWVQYGAVTLTAGAHTLDIEALPNATGVYARLLDALVLAVGPFTPRGKTPPPATRFMHDLLADQPVEVVLDSSTIVRAQMPRLHRGVALYSLGQTFDGQAAYTAAMKALGVNLSRLFRYHSALYPVPRLDSSSQWPCLRAFLEHRGIPSEQQQLLTYFTDTHGKGRQAERTAQLRALQHFLETEQISFTQPDGDTWDSAIHAYRAVQEFGGVHLISHSERFPQWLSSRPTADAPHTSGTQRIPLYEVFPPTDLRGYTALWKRDIAALTQRVPGLVTYWEVHNEPDLGEFLRVPADTPPDTPSYQQQLVTRYLQLYDAAAQAVRESGVRLKLGGTSSHVLPEDAIIPQLITHVQQAGQPLDFLSWHAYVNQPIDITNAVVAVRSMLRTAGLPLVELLIDEWNLHGAGGTTSAQAALFNGHFSAALAAASLGAMTYADLDRAVFFYDRDQRPQPAGRHFGLLTYEARKKPVYFTFRMFEQLGDVQLQLSFSSQFKIGGLATRRTDGTLVLILWNYDVSQRVQRQVHLRLGAHGSLVYDRYLIDAQHTLLGADTMQQVAYRTQDTAFMLPPNSVTLLSFQPEE